MGECLVLIRLVTVSLLSAVNEAADQREVDACGSSLNGRVRGDAELNRRDACRLNRRVAADSTGEWRAWPNRRDAGVVAWCGRGEERVSCGVQTDEWLRRDGGR